MKSRETVVRKFRFMANLAREAHLKNLQEGEIKTTYIQFDEMETFEKSKENPLGIELAIRPKTYQIVSARVCRIPIKGASVGQDKIDLARKRANRPVAQSAMCLEIERVLKDSATLRGDGKIPKVVKDFFGSHEIISEWDFEAKKQALWRINHICAKLRHHMSRLNRKTWATTKSIDRLQMHLDLFIAYQNGYDVLKY